METKGIITGIDVLNGVVSLKTDATADLLEELTVYMTKGQKMTLRLTKHREGRSLDANAYYNVLVRKIAHERNISEAEYHNRSLAEVGIPMLDAEGNRILVMMKDNDQWLKQLQGENHYAPTTKTATAKDGSVWRWFYLLLPSRLMNTREMSMLIDYVVQDAQALGIETQTPDQIAHMMTLWGSRNE